MKSKILIVLAAEMLVNAIVGVTIASTMSITTNPIVIGQAIDVEFDGNFERLYSSDRNRTTIGRVMPPSIHQSERRAILEFDISGVPDGAFIEKANLTMGWYSGSIMSPRTNLYGFVGDGVLDSTDVIQTNNLIAGGLAHLWMVDVTLFVQYLVDNSCSYAGFLGVETRNGANRNYGYFPLTIDYVPEPATPPIADADGPYSIYVGDILTLDGSGSTDDDNDIVSYLWDLDDDENFETDAGGQAVFDVNYAYLQSLELLINHTYTIHLKVTDSENQSDTADSTLTIVPKPALVVAVDIKPTSCPNPVNVKSSGVLPIAILGTDDYDVTTIDPTSIRLAGVEPLRSGYEDVAAPISDVNDCNCTEAGPDGYLDLTLKFETQGIVKAIGDVNDGDVLTLELTGVLYDPIPFETPIEGADCILIKGWHKAHNKADINKDGVVDMTDFAIISENWLKFSIVDN